MVQVGRPSSVCRFVLYDRDRVVVVVDEMPNGVALAASVVVVEDVVGSGVVVADEVVGGEEEFEAVATLVAMAVGAACLGWNWMPVAVGAMRCLEGVLEHRRVDTDWPEVLDMGVVFRRKHHVVLE